LTDQKREQLDGIRYAQSVRLGRVLGGDEPTTFDHLQLAEAELINERSAWDNQISKQSGYIPMKRILAFVSEFPPFRGGIATYAFEMAQAAQALGHDVTVVGPDYGGNTLESDRAYGFRVIRYPGGRHSMRQMPSKISIVKRHLDPSQYDLIHAMDWPFFIPVAIGAKALQRMYTIHGTDVVDMGSLLRQLAIRSTGVFRDNFEVVANSEFTRKLFLSKFPNVERVRVRHELLGVGSYWTKRQLRNPHLRSELGLPTDKFILLTVARLTPRKGHMTVLQALNRLPETVKMNLCYAIVGPATDASYSAKVQAAAETCGVEVRHLGEVHNSDLRRIYAVGDLFCLVGKPIPNGPVEGFGLVFLEAAGQGMPSIAGDIGGVKEVVLNGRSGVIVPVENPQALADAILRLIERPVELARLGAGARKRAELLSWQRCVRGTYGA
jgi:glycosyltransferase involved in cell wall biosynthesis